MRRVSSGRGERRAHRSIEDLDGPWGRAPEDATPMVQRAHRLRVLPIGDLEADDLRFLIGQEVGLDHLVPLAMDLLRKDPLQEAALYPGDLLAAVRRVPSTWWVAHPEAADLLAMIDPPLGSASARPRSEGDGGL